MTTRTLPPALNTFTYISYRQIDYWLRQGVIDIYDATPGSGNNRDFSLLDLDRLAVIDRMLPGLNMVDEGHSRPAYTSTGIITAVWNYLADRPWPNELWLSRLDGIWQVTGEPANQPTIIIPIGARP